MRLSVEEFRDWDHKAITLLGMSGVGKTRLACLLRQADWFHYSGDYRIGTRYLNELILDNIKKQAMQNPLLRQLLRSDSINLYNNISIDNLKILSSFLGQLGDPEQGGLGLREFKERHRLYRQAEIAAMRDVPYFMQRAHDVYGYKHFINDAGGSLCELDDPEVMACLKRHTLVLYIRATEEDEQELIRRAERAPKPLYYQATFLDKQLAIYMKAYDLDYAALIPPDHFVRWIFPRLLQDRLPRYADLAARYGYVLSSEEVATVGSEQAFLALVEAALARADG